MFGIVDFVYFCRCLRFDTISDCQKHLTIFVVGFDSGGIRCFAFEDLMIDSDGLRVRLGGQGGRWLPDCHSGLREIPGKPV